MRQPKKQSWLRALALVLAAMMFLASCGSSDDTAGDTSAEDAKAKAEAAASGETEEAASEGDSGEAASEGEQPFAGTEITITGPERSEAEAGGIQKALDVYAEETGMIIHYVGSSDWEAEINIQVEAGTPPEISMFPQPGKLSDFARAGHVFEVPADVLASVEEHWTAPAMGFGQTDGVQYGVPAKSDLKSLVWYQPAKFEAAGYEIPNTIEELKALAGQMIEDGNTPFCVGIESGEATGWPFTDWVEDMMLRRHSPEDYDAWVAGELKFSDPKVVGVIEEVLELWNTPGMVYADNGSIASTSFQANGTPLVSGDCMMHRQASFFSAFFPEGTPAADGSEGAVDVFYFPEGDTGRPVLSAGLLAGALVDSPAVWAVMDYLGSPEYANNRQIAQKEIQGGGEVLSGFNTGNINIDKSLWEPLEQSFQQIMADAEVMRFDGSDLMPGDVGAGTFWTEGTAMVNGDKSVADATAAIDASWPE